jgi:hypothetical protein
MDLKTCFLCTQYSTSLDAVVGTLAPGREKVNLLRILIVDKHKRVAMLDKHSISPLSTSQVCIMFPAQLRAASSRKDFRTQH